MDYPLTTTATLLAALEHTILQLRVGKARHDYKIFPPSMGEDNVEFRKVLRTHENHGENLHIFLPALWIATLASKSDTYIGGAGIAWVAARAAYAWGYSQEAPKWRAPGFKVALLLQNGLLLTGLAFAGKALYDKCCK